MKKPFTLLASDGYPLAATLFTPAGQSSKIVVVNSATGVKQQVYFSFASYLSEAGFYVLCYDYRGIGDSKPDELRGFKGSMRDWGALDYKAVTGYLKTNFNGFETFVVGHSVGALILGMNTDSQDIDKFVFIGTQNAYVGNLDFKTQVMGALGFGLLQPVITRIMGYFPASYFSLGESLPSDASFDWRTLILHKKSTDRLLEKSKVDVSKQLNQRALVLWASDDAWLTKSGVDHLLDQTYPNLKPQYQILRPSESPKGVIGHVNFFRSYNKVLWERVLTYLKDDE